MKTYYITKTLNYKSRFDTYGEAVHHAAEMSELTGYPSFIFKRVSVVKVTGKTMTLTPCDNDDA